MAMRETRHRARSAGLVRLGAVLALVFGIFAMHAMSDSTRPEAGAGHGSAHAVHSSGVIGHHLDQLQGGGGTADAGGSGHTMTEMVMLCGAMIAGVTTLLTLLARLRRVPRLWAVLRAAPVSVRSIPWLTPTGTGPPTVWQFSVIRC